MDPAALWPNATVAPAALVLAENGKRRLQTIVEVQAVGMASRTPLELNNNGFGIFIDGHLREG